jgi:DNA-binding SARP family transcriptional activator
VDLKPVVKGVRLLGGVHAVAVDGSTIDLPSASQRRLLAILALYSPRRLRSEWLADILGISPGGLRMAVSRLRTAISEAVLQTSSTGYSVVADVDVLQFSEAVAGAADADDRTRALERALGLWTGPVLEEFSGEEWADGEIARFTELHAGTVDDYAAELISAAGRPTRSRCSKPRSRGPRTACLRASRFSIRHVQGTRIGSSVGAQR